MKLIPVICALSFGSLSLPAQTLYVPGGTAGVGASTTTNVGIGTSAPAAKLHVKGDALASTAGAVTTLLTLQNANANQNYLNVIQIRNSAGGNWDTATTRIQQVTDTVNQGYIDFNPSGSTYGLAFGSNAGEVVRFLSTGRVGIGTSAPSAKLNVIATGTNDGVAIGNGANMVKFMPGTVSNGAYNPITRAGDNVILYTAGTQGTGALVIAPWASSKGGLRMDSAGNVGIGTSAPDADLAVNGTIHAKEVIVDTSSAAWSDYVFSPEYRLAPLSEVEQHIKAEQHLPGIPSAAEVAEHGISVGEMQAKLLAKIEELTLHVIEQEKRTQAQAAGMAALLAENAELRAENNEVEHRIRQLESR